MDAPTEPGSPLTERGSPTADVSMRLEAMRSYRGLTGGGAECIISNTVAIFLLILHM
jgi:hypothetical protein